MGQDKSFTAKVRKRGRITIDKEIRDELNIEEGDEVEIKIRKSEDDW